MPDEAARVTTPAPVLKTERTTLPFDDVAAWRLRGRRWQQTTGLPRPRLHLPMIRRALAIYLDLSKLRLSPAAKQ